MRIRFTRQAVGDLERIAAYLTAHNPRAAKRVRTAILASIAVLRRFPAAGRAQTTEGVRKLVARKYRYLIYYRVEDDAVAILSIQHPAQEREYQDD